MTTTAMGLVLASALESLAETAEVHRRLEALIAAESDTVVRAALATAQGPERGPRAK